MKGLILKDFYILFGLYSKNLFFVALLYAAIYLIGGMSFFLFMFIAMSAFYCLTTFTLDDASGWNRYAKTLPVSTQQIIGGKWIVSLAFLAVSTGYTLFFGAIGSVVHQTSYMEVAAGTAATLAITMLILSILLPTTLKWGVDKARNSFLLLFAAVFGTIFLIGRYWAGPVPQLSISIPLLIGSALVLLLVIMAVSYQICCNIYTKKEF